jgi:OFA family oxalate/formate antiporter-like MFS transporter
MDGEEYAERAREELGYSRWIPLLAAAAMMGVISPYQYVWSSIEGPLANALSVPSAQLGLTFTLFVLFQAGSQFPVGWWRDRHGPRAITLVASVLAGGGYIGLAYATSVTQLYVFYSLGAIGVGIVYTVAVNTALKWFPDRRGLTAGIGTMAFAAGSALFIPYVRANATVAGYPNVLRNMGVLIAVVILLGAFTLRDPPSDLFAEGKTDGGEPEEATEPDDDATETTRGDDYGPREVLGTWQFWTMYAMFIGVSGAGLMLTAKVVSFAQATGMTALITTVAAMVLPLSGGAGRLILGEISDRVDRERAMAVSFTLCGLGVFAVVGASLVGSDIAFVAAVVVATFFWSPQYTLFPSVVGDYYGEQNSSANYALLYSGKVWGGVFGGALASALVSLTSWTVAFSVGGVLALAAGAAALTLRAPSRAG